MNSRKSQSIVDFAIAFIAIAGLLVGIARTWIWFNANYARRQAAFQTSRLISAGRERPYDTQPKPVNIGAKPGCTGEGCLYTPLNLTEDWVFRGTPSGTVSGANLTGGNIEDPTFACDNTCKQQCLGQSGCSGLGGDFDRNCPCYKACSLKCMCVSRTQMLVDIYEDQAASLRSSATSLNNSASSMREAAEECDDPWELCWWGDWGRTPSELRRAANRLDFSAAQLRHSADKAHQYGVNSMACCNKTTALSQSNCFKAVEKDSTCDQNCMERSQSSYNSCADRVPLWAMGICWQTADSVYAQCYALCMGTQTGSCSERVQAAVASIQAEIGSLNTTKTDYQTIVSEIGSTLSSCSSQCAVQCDDDPDPVGCIVACKDNCCQQECCNGGSWGRKCYEPVTDCDSSCTSTPCPKCGLSKVRDYLRGEIAKIPGKIAALELKIQELPNCCNNPDPASQNDCIEGIISPSR